jgi:hypothetical protein
VLRERCGVGIVVLMLGRRSVACAALRSRFKRRIYQPRARKTATPREQMLTAIPAFAASESWAGTGAGARGVFVAVGTDEMVLDGAREEGSLGEKVNWRDRVLERELGLGLGVGLVVAITMLEDTALDINPPTRLLPLPPNTLQPERSLTIASFWSASPHPCSTHPFIFPMMFPGPQWHAKSDSFAHPSLKIPFSKHVRAHFGSCNVSNEDCRRDRCCGIE